MFRRFLGLLMLLIGLGGIGMAVVGARLGHQLVDRVAVNFEETLQRTSDSLDLVSETLALAKSSIADVNAVVDTAGTTADNLATSVADTSMRERSAWSSSAETAFSDIVKPSFIVCGQCRDAVP